MKKLLPVLLAVIGIGGGVGAGIMLRPAPTEDQVVQECVPYQEYAALKALVEEEVGIEEDSNREYVKLNNQFVVPVIEGPRVSALVVMSLSVEVAPSDVESVFSREPKLRDAFLQVLFDHANMGGFLGAFTNANNMDILRRSLLEASYHAVGDLITDVLITEVAKQDV